MGYEPDIKIILNKRYRKEWKEYFEVALDQFLISHGFRLSKPFGETSELHFAQFGVCHPITEGVLSEKAID